MPNTNIKYESTIIYKIQSNSNKELVYIGHTTNFTKRKAYHKYNSICEMPSKQTKLYQMIRSNGGWDEFEMMPIKNVRCLNSVEARIEEEKCRLEYSANLNMIRAVKNEEADREYRKKYKQNNKSKIRQQWKDYYQENKEHFKQYREGRKDITKEYKKEYYEKNKDEINKAKGNICVCQCGQQYTYSNKARHEKSKKHLSSL